MRSQLVRSQKFGRANVYLIVGPKSCSLVFRVTWPFWNVDDSEVICSLVNGHFEWSPDSYYFQPSALLNLRKSLSKSDLFSERKKTEKIYSEMYGEFFVRRNFQRRKLKEFSLEFVVKCSSHNQIETAQVHYNTHWIERNSTSLWWGLYAYDASILNDVIKLCGKRWWRPCITDADDTKQAMIELTFYDIWVSFNLTIRFSSPLLVSISSYFHPFVYSDQPKLCKDYSSILAVAPAFKAPPIFPFLYSE